MTTETEIVPTCPQCKGTEFIDYNGRPAVRCANCRSLERTRVVYLFLDRHVCPQRGWKVLHLAPEATLSKHLHDLVGDGYEPADLDPARYATRAPVPVRQLDLCEGAAKLPSDHYDLVIHNHVLEHVPCNYTLVLQHLHRAVKPGGVHLFSVPMAPGYSSEDLNPEVTKAERKARYLQHDHMRKFGRKDFNMTIGAVLGLTDAYSLLDFFTREELLGAKVPESKWHMGGPSVFMVRKT